MNEGDTGRSHKPPEGLFSSRSLNAPSNKRGDATSGDAPTAPPDGVAFEQPTKDIPALLSGRAPQPQQPPADEVFDELVHNQTERSSSSFPPPLGHSEGHDAWTLDRMSRQSTVPPERNEEVDRLRELSALRTSRRPEPMPDATGGDALDLVNRSRPSQQLDLVGEMEELYALDDLTGALRFAELVLGRAPDNEQARRCAQNCRDRLIALYSSKIGDLDDVPVPALGENELRWLGLDHRSGFLLSRVDGIATIEEVLDVCGMPRLEALKTLVDLLERGAIRIQ